MMKMEFEIHVTVFLLLYWHAREWAGRAGAGSGGADIPTPSTFLAPLPDVQYFQVEAVESL